MKKYFSIISFSILIILLSIIAISSFKLNKKAEELSELENTQYKLFTLGNELKESSELLTKYCRAFVITGDSAWENNYWKLVKIRNGEINRNNGRKIGLIDSISKHKITNEELDKLKLAEINSNKLISTEKKAFNTLKGIKIDSASGNISKIIPDTSFAIKLLFDTNYFAAKSSIMLPIEEFSKMLNNRILNEINIKKKENLNLLYTIIINLLMIILLSIYIIFTLQKQNIKQVKFLSISNEKLSILYENVNKINIDNKNKINELNELNKKLEETKINAENEKNKFHDTVKFSPTPIALAYSSGEMLLVNKKFTETYGYTIEDMPTINDWLLKAYPDTKYREEVLKTWIPDVEYAVKNNKSTPIREYFVTTKSENVKSVEITMFNTNNIYVASFIDTTEKKKLEGQFKNLFDSFPFAIVMVNEKGIIELINNGTEKLVGYNKEELLGNNLDILIPLNFRQNHNNYTKHYHENPSTRNMGIGRDLFVLHKDGTNLPVEIGLNQIYTNEGKFVVASIFDISIRKNLEKDIKENTIKIELQNQQLKASENRLMELNATKD